MPAYISQDKIDEIRDRIDIVQLISDHLDLKRRGKNYVGLCPFHSEKTPSFTVSEEKQIFHCFGCGKGGNVFTFLMEYNNLTFPEVLRSLAERAGIILPRYEEKERTTEKDRLKKGILAVNKLAMEFYHNQLIHSPSARLAREYLSRRGLSEETIKEFKLGFADRMGQGLLKSLRKSSSIPLEIVEKAGLFTSKDNGHTLTERFRGRLIFPIIDVKSRCIGIGGRILGEGQPKYLNSPETPVFKKGDTFYGLNASKTFIQKEGTVLIVEGYFDLLALYQGGIKNVVATLGTALTSRHLKNLKRYTRVFYIIFDSDEAGVKAAMRSLPIFLEEEVCSRIVLLGEEKDPAQVIVEDGKEEMLRLIREFRPLIDFYIKEKSKEFDLRDPNGKVSFVEGVLPVLRLIKNPLERGVYIKVLSEIVDIGEEFIISRIKALSSAKSRDIKNRMEVGVVHLQSFKKAQEDLLRIFLIKPELYTEEFHKVFEEFEDEDLKGAGRIWEGLFNKGMKLNFSVLIDYIDDEKLKSRLSELFVDDDNVRGDLERILRDCWRTIRLNSLEAKKRELFRRIKEAEEGRQEESLMGLLEKKQELISLEKSLKV